MQPERWLILTALVPDARFLDDAAAALIELGGSAVQQTADRLTTHVAAPADPDAFVARVRERLGDVAADVELTWGWLAAEDWSVHWRRGLQPRRVDERLVVSPTWAEPSLRPGDVAIFLDPEMAFGTGEHATTRGSLRLLQQALRGGDRVLDVGTGSAILAIAAARLGAADVLAVESDADALGNARDNVARNDAPAVRLVNALVDAAFLAREGAGRFELILANVLSGVLRPLLPSFHAALAADGRLVLAGILEEEAEEMSAAAAAAGFRLLIEDLEGEWWSALFAREAGAAGA